MMPWRFSAQELYVTCSTKSFLFKNTKRQLGHSLLDILMSLCFVIFESLWHYNDVINKKKNVVPTLNITSVCVGGWRGGFGVYGTTG
jgi:hypothetical protein